MALIRGHRMAGMVVHNAVQTTLKHRFEGQLWRKLSVGSRPIAVGLNVSNVALVVIEFYDSEDS